MLGKIWDSIKGLFYAKEDPNLLQAGDPVVWYDAYGDYVPEHLAGKVKQRIDDNTLLIELQDSHLTGMYKVVDEKYCAKIAPEEYILYTTEVVAVAEEVKPEEPK